MQGIDSKRGYAHGCAVCRKGTEHFSATAHVLTPSGRQGGPKNAVHFVEPCGGISGPSHSLSYSDYLSPASM